MARFPNAMTPKARFPAENNPNVKIPAEKHPSDNRPMEMIPLEKIPNDNKPEEKKPILTIPCAVGINCFLCRSVLIANWRLCHSSSERFGMTMCSKGSVNKRVVDRYSKYSSGSRSFNKLSNERSNNCAIRFKVSISGYPAPVSLS